MAKKVRVLVLRTAGTNCNRETAYAFRAAGAEAEEVHINRLFHRQKELDDYHILAIPGGFSYGDDIAAGRILANELRLRLGKPVRKFISDGKAVIGICNGFQVLVKAGLLPGPPGRPSKVKQFAQTATLMINDSGKFEDRWTFLKPEGYSVWTEGLKGVLFIPVAHAEGKFVPASTRLLRTLERNRRVIFRYCDPGGATADYPFNPNGSVGHIAGIADATGRVLGMMPHPERHFWPTQHPLWTRHDKRRRFGDGALIIRNGVDYIRRHIL